MPVIPPGAELSPRSSLHGRLLAGKDERGKTPGRRNAEGLWASFDWTAFECGEADVDRFDVMGCSIGLKTGDGLIAVDLDSVDPVAAEWLYRLALEMLGAGAVRIGRFPKRLLLFRVSAPIAYDKLKFATATEQDPRKPALVEILTEGRQFVAAGIHPVTMKPYTWPAGLPPRDALPEVTPEAVGAFMAAVASHFPAAERFSASGADRLEVNQSALAGDPELVRRAVAALPNRSDLFPSRDDYLRVGYAVKAAIDDEGEAYDLWAQWCGRWDGGENDPAVMEADWARMKPPYGLGATWLYEQAERLGGWMGRVERWFQPITEAELESHVDAGAKAVEPVRIDDRDFGPFARDTPPVQEWVVEGWIPRGEVTLSYGAGGVGKSLVIHQLAICLAAGIPWLGQPTTPQRVYYFNCEDSWDELWRRHHAIMKGYGLAPDALGDRFRGVSRKNEINTLMYFDRDNKAHRTELWAALRGRIVECRSQVLIADTLADIFGGNESDKGHANAFVKACLGALGVSMDGGKGSVITLSHPSRAGLSSGDGKSGSMQWENAARSRFYMQRIEGKEASNFREIRGMKINAGPIGNLLKVEWRKGLFHLDSANTFAIEQPEAGAAPSRRIDEAVERAVVEAVRRCAGSVSMSFAARSPNKAFKVLPERHPELFTRFNDEEIRHAIDTLSARGVLTSVDMNEKDSAGRVRKTIVLGANATPGDLFE